MKYLGTFNVFPIQISNRVPCDTQLKPALISVNFNLVQLCIHTYLFLIHERRNIAQINTEIQRAVVVCTHAQTTITIHAFFDCSYLQTDSPFLRQTVTVSLALLGPFQFFFCFTWLQSSHLFIRNAYQIIIKINLIAAFCKRLQLSSRY